MVLRFLSRWPALAAALLLAPGCSSVRNTTSSFNTVVIDAGHGGHDRGANSRVGDPEKMKALDTALRLDAKLRSAGFKTVLTRSSDQFVSLGARSRLSNRQSNAIFVSVHYNSAPNSAATGTETYFHDKVANPLARKIEGELSTIPGNRSRGAKQADFYVLRTATFPAVLVECAFLSNRWEAGRASSENYRDLVAEKVAEALIEQRFGKRGAISRLAAMRGAAAPAGS